MQTLQRGAALLFDTERRDISLRYRPRTRDATSNAIGCVSSIGTYKERSPLPADIQASMSQVKP